MSNGIRTFKLAALAGATVLLAFGAWTAQNGLKTLARERQQAASTQASLANARQLVPEVERRERMAASVEALAQEVQRLGFDPAQWGERRIRRLSAPATRQEAAQLLGDLGSGSLFVSDTFELAVASHGAGLFHPPRPGDQGVTLAYSGTLHFKSADAPGQRQP